MSNQTLYLTHGIPGSGKSTWAKARFPPDRIVRTDTIRFKLWEEILARGQKIDIKAVQPITWNIAKRTAIDLMQSGEPIIIDSCNTSRQTIDEWLNIANTHGYSLAIIDFSQVSLKTCLKRNHTRQGWEHVSLDIILKHYRQLLNCDISDLTCILPDELPQTH